MPFNAEDECPRPQQVSPLAVKSLVPPIFPATVYRCDTPDAAAGILSGEAPGYAYARDGQPNADMLAEKCRRLHGADHATMTNSGMSAMALSILSQAVAGDHLVVSKMLYGQSLNLLTNYVTRLGIRSTAVDTCDLDATAAAIEDGTKLVIAETMTNPSLRVSDIAALAELAHARGALLLIDNTFATPALCRPIELGADFVLESVTKMLNGHSDAMLGLLCGTQAVWDRVRPTQSVWGLSSNAFDCWLSYRGLSTMALRIEKANANAMKVATFLDDRSEVVDVKYPGLESHPDHELAKRQLDDGFGTIVTFTLEGDRPAAEKFIAAAQESIPFCPSLGEVSTTLLHPQSTSHRQLDDAELNSLGLTGGSIRLSVGVESADSILAALDGALAESVKAEWAMFRKCAKTVS
ncbi:MAG: aminotransferase class I/II-fold pyridoxal phosphate-dependent enzyme [Pirellulales bacterium]|nr:aminotransferase class I/II-fold pyridoxal phosphate-dependent enzyme [Pirellulales bacterium]